MKPLALSRLQLLLGQFGPSFGTFASPPDLIECRSFFSRLGRIRLFSTDRSELLQSTTKESQDRSSFGPSFLYVIEPVLLRSLGYLG